jgi:peroxiredoxin
VKIGNQAPEIREILGWINRDPTSVEALIGNPVLLFFWDHTCLGCVQALPFVSRLHEHYREDGLEILGIHSPEEAFAKQMDNLEMAIAAHGITFPVAQDDRLTSWLAYGNRYLPKMFIISSDGVVSYEHVGTGNERDMEQRIRNELGLADDDMPVPLWTLPGKKITAWDSVTPPVYMGYKEILSVASPLSSGNRGDIYHVDPGDQDQGTTYLNGSWQQYDLYIEHQDGEEGHVRIAFTAQNAYAVLCAPSFPASVEVLMDGNPLNASIAGRDIVEGEGGSSRIMVDRGKLYHLVTLQECEQHELTIRVSEPGLQLYNFQFD